MRWFFIAVFVPVSIIIPLGTALLKYRCLPAAARILFSYLILAGCTNLAAIILASQSVNNLPLLHVFTAAEFIMLSVFYKKILSSRKVLLLLRVSLFLFPVVCLLNACFLQPVNSYNTYTRSLEALILMVFSLCYLNELLNQAVIKDFVNDPIFWMNTGLFIYFSGSLLLFLFAAFLAAHRQIDIWAWRVHAILVLLMYLLFTTGFLKCKK